VTSRRSILPQKKKTGFPVVISGPSGAGKTALCKRLLRSDDRLFYSVSATTRPRRKGERHGRDYVLVSKEEFDQYKKQGEFLEWARVHGEYYGTLKKPVERNIRKGRVVVLDVDVQGGRQLKNVFKDGVFIYVVPPSLQVLRERLLSRGTETPQAIARRMKNARKELSLVKQYSYVVVNDVLSRATQQLRAIIESERCRTARYKVSR
jgi:guanylate kinase